MSTSYHKRLRCQVIIFTSNIKTGETINTPIATPTNTPNQNGSFIVNLQNRDNKTLEADASHRSAQAVIILFAPLPPYLWQPACLGETGDTVPDS